jgi:hypothetical protein
MGRRPQGKLRRGIEKAFDGAERYEKFLSNLIERELDFELAFVNAQIPELMLQNDGHFLLVLLAQAFGNPYLRMACVEGNVKVMFSRQARLLDPQQGGANNTAQGILGKQIISHHILSHGITCAAKTHTTHFIRRMPPLDF